MFSVAHTGNRKTYWQKAAVSFGSESIIQRSRPDSRIIFFRPCSKHFLVESESAESDEKHQQFKCPNAVETSPQSAGLILFPPVIVQSAISLVHACLRSSINLRKHFLSPLFLCRQSQRRFCAGAVRCCVMNGKARQSEDHVLARIFRISSQGRQMKAPVCVTILLSPSSICQHFSSHRSDLIGWSSEAVCPFYLQLISAAFAGASSP